MMHVAPMPERPPFMNGLTVFQTALSDIVGVRRVGGALRTESAEWSEGLECPFRDIMTPLLQYSPHVALK